MNKNKKYLLDLIKEFKPKVEKISGLKFNLDKIYIGLTRNIFWPIIFSGGSIKKIIIYHYHFGGMYHPFFSVLSFPREIIREKYFRGLLIHELMHVCQYHSFPDLHKRESDYNIKFPRSDFNPYAKLIEGDANLIVSHFNFPEKKITLPRWAIKFIGKSYYKRFLQKIRTNYEGGDKILKKFGGDRKKINKLYNLSEKDLLKIFKKKVK